ncbi:hypothetical protein ACPB8Q_00075 [Methanocaldococcus indicus]|uniref:hypothetical protein n=1 Tax=Methanocaldococcus indicus TaxID=213231 RepID=UPI003C6D2B3E
MERKKKHDILYVKIYLDGGCVLEGYYDFDAVTLLKNSLLKYLWTGKRDAVIIWNIKEKKFSIINLDKVSGIEVVGSLMFLDDIPEKKISGYSKE